MHFTLRTAVLAGLVASAAAHFKIATPQTRGFNSEVEPTAPCGGYDAAKDDRIFSFPQTGGNVTLSIEDGRGSLTFAYASGKSSTNFVSLNITTPYDAQSNPSLSQAINLIGIANVGDAGVLQVVAHVTGEETLYQCADIVVATEGTAINNIGKSSASSLTATGSSTLIALSVAAMSLSL